MKNDYEIRGDVGVIYINHRGNKICTVVDTEDLEKCKSIRGTWVVTNKKGSLYVWIRCLDTLDCIYLHRLVMGCKSKQEIDHIRRSTLDNRKSRLEEVTSSENSQNTGIQSNNTSGVRGVSWNKSKDKWECYIKVKGKKKFLGRFTDLEEAKKVVEVARNKYHKRAVKIRKGTV